METISAGDLAASNARLCFICGRNQFSGECFCLLSGKNVSFLIILSFGKINKKMIWAPDLGLEFESLHAAGLNHSFK